MYNNIKFNKCIVGHLLQMDWNWMHHTYYTNNFSTAFFTRHHEWRQREIPRQRENDEKEMSFIRWLLYIWFDMFFFPLFRLKLIHWFSLWSYIFSMGTWPDIILNADQLLLSNYDCITYYYTINVTTMTVENHGDHKTCVRQ